MAKNARYSLPFRRRREGKTDFRARLALIKSQVPRAVVRRSLKAVQVQLISFNIKGDEIVASASSADLKKYGWERATCNVPSAYMVGYIAGKRALEKGIESAVLDIGLRRPTNGNRSFAALKGMVDAGLEIPHGEDIIPSEERIRGAHMEAEQDFDKVMSSIKEAFQ
jgi:large subunit ribosomal protein L18